MTMLSRLCSTIINEFIVMKISVTINKESSPHLSSNTEAFISETLENLEEMFPW